MLWPKINSYKEFDNQKKNSCGSQNSPPSHTHPPPPPMKINSNKKSENSISVCKTVAFINTK